MSGPDIQETVKRQERMTGSTARGLKARAVVVTRLDQEGRIIVTMASSDVEGLNPADLQRQMLAEVLVNALEPGSSAEVLTASGVVRVMRP